jgi:hypothetical protein
MSSWPLMQTRGGRCLRPEPGERLSSATIPVVAGASVQVSGAMYLLACGKDEMRRLFAVAIALTVLSACSQSSQVIEQTDVKTFIPWKSDGSSTIVKVRDQVSGSCFGASAKVDAAYRCFAAAEILEPCFAPPSVPNPNVVACAADPWSELRLVNISGGLPETIPATEANPHWAMELENSDRCVSLGTGIGGDGGDGAMRYTCKSGSTAGDFQKTTQPWVVRYNKNNISFDLTPMKVAEAW